MSMQKHSKTRAFGGRWLSASSLVCFALLAAVGCGDDEKGTDIEVPADGGSGGNNSISGGTNGQAGTTSPSDGGMPSTMAGSGGRAGGSSGGNAGSGNAGSGGQAGNGGNAGSTGSGGSSGGGAGGMSGGAGLGGMAGSAGTAGAGGTSAGTSGGGSAGTAGTGGTGGGSSTCGDSKKEGTEECDDGGPSRLCSDDCRTVSTAECVACEQAGDCAFSSDNCLGPEATPFTTQQVGLCYDVLRCIQDSNCLDGAGSLGKCYCGTLTNPQCSAAPFDLKANGAPNGPCAGPMQLGAAGVTTNQQMLAGLTTKTRATGAAGQRLNCQKASDDCKSICGVQ